jgi:hypothetical protein
VTAVTTIIAALTLVAILGSAPGTAEPTRVLGTTLNASAFRGANLPAQNELTLARNLVRIRATQRLWVAEHTPAAKRARAAHRKLEARRRAAHARAVAAARAAAARQAAAAKQQAAAAQAAAAQQAAAATPAVAGAPAGFTPGECGGSLPTCCIMMRESGGNPTVYNPSGASGKWQFMPGTWAGYGGYGSAAQAPEWVQDARAAQIWAGGAGASNWAGDGC